MLHFCDICDVVSPPTQTLGDASPVPNGLTPLSANRLFELLPIRTIDYRMHWFLQRDRIRIIKINSMCLEHIDKEVRKCMRYTPWVKKQDTVLVFYHNFGKFEPISNYRLFRKEIWYASRLNISTSPLVCRYTTLWKLMLLTWIVMNNKFLHEWLTTISETRGYLDSIPCWPLCLNQHNGEWTAIQFGHTKSPAVSVHCSEFSFCDRWLSSCGIFRYLSAKRQKWKNILAQISLTKRNASAV